MLGVRPKASNITIPKGKILTIMRGGKVSIPANVPCVLEEDITITLSSTFAPILAGGMPNIIKLLAPVIGGIIDKDIPVGFKQFGYQLWQSTDPLSLSPTIAFYMDTNAETDVYNPTIELMKLPLPEEIGNKGGLKAPGPTIATMLTGEGKSTNVEKDKSWFEEYAGRIRMDVNERLSLQIGELLYLYNVIVKKAEPTFSIETDERGFSIWSKIRLDISSVEIATKRMISTRFEE